MMTKTKRVVLSALFAALIAAATLTLQVSVGYGYVHVGDSLIYLAAVLLPQPFAAISALAGGVLADLLCGAAVWAPFTAVIKALNTLPFLLAAKSDRILSVRAVTLSLVSGVITVVGYFLAEWLLYGLAAAAAGAVGSAVQAAVSTAAFAVAGLALDKFNFRNRMN